MPIKSIHDSWEEVIMSTVTRIWKKLILTLMDDFEGFSEVTVYMVEIARELETEVGPEELLQSHDKI